MPVTTSVLLGAALAAGVAGIAVSTIAGIQQAKFQAAIAKRSAEVAELNAERAIQRGQVEAQDEQRLAAGVIADLTSKQAGSGLSLTSGSFSKKRQTLRQLAQLDTLRIINRSEVDSFNFLQEATASSAAAKAFKRKATFTAIAGGFNIASLIGSSSLVSGAATSGSLQSGTGKSAGKFGA